MIDALPWQDIARSLDVQGYASLGKLLDPKTCKALVRAYSDDARYRSVIDMARYNFGSGQYKYFRYPLPEPIGTLRAALYPPLAEIANGWADRLKRDHRFPLNHADFVRSCHYAGQARPAPLILSYEAGDFNCLHQDLYGDISFPLQLVVMLSDPSQDFEGGEFVLTEQRPRMQSRATVVSMAQGEAIVFPVNERPVQGKQRDYRVKMRHGVSTLRCGQRFTLGIIFHDAA